MSSGSIYRMTLPGACRLPLPGEQVCIVCDSQLTSSVHTSGCDSTRLCGKVDRLGGETSKLEFYSLFSHAYFGMRAEQ